MGERERVFIYFIEKVSWIVNGHAGKRWTPLIHVSDTPLTETDK